MIRGDTRGVPMGGRGGRSLGRGGERRRCVEGVAEGAVRPLLNGGKAAGALTAWFPPGSCGGVSCRRGWSLCFSVSGSWKMLQRYQAAAEEVAAAESVAALGWREGGGGGVRGRTV